MYLFIKIVLTILILYPVLIDPFIFHPELLANGQGEAYGFFLFPTILFIIIVWVVLDRVKKGRIERAKVKAETRRLYEKKKHADQR